MKKIKISELPEGSSLKGLYTMGTDANNQSVKVSLEFVETRTAAAETAAADAQTATEAAKTATINAATAASTASGAAQNAEEQAAAAKEAAAGASQAADDATQAADAATEATTKATTATTAATEATTKANEAATAASAAATEVKPAVTALQADVEHLNTTMGPYTDRESITLTPIATGYVIDNNGNKVAKSGWAMAEFTAEKGNVYLFKPNVQDGTVSIFAEAITSIETRAVDYTYTYNEDGTIATAVATYNGKTHSYTYTYAEDGSVTITEDGVGEVHALPLTYTTTVGSYSPLVRLNANAELPKDGYCRYMSHFKGNSSLKVVVSYKVGTADLTMLVTRDGVLASISTQLGNLSQKEDETRNEIAKMKEEYGEEYFSYGVQRDLTVASPTLTRIGNMALHKTLPIQSKMRGCLLDDNGNVVQYLDAKDWTGETRDGSKGQVMVEIPAHYRKFTLDGNVYSCRLSEVPLAGYHRVPKMYISAYEAAANRSEKKLYSIVNLDPKYRGGNSYQNVWDEDFRCQLGMPATSISLTTYREYARNRGTAGLNGCGWNCLTYDAYKAVYWLFVVEYATLNSQLDYNAELTTEGFHQGGLGAGVTNVNYIQWLGWMGYFPFIPCGFTDSLGNATCIVDYTFDFIFDAIPTPTTRLWYTYEASRTYAKGYYIYSGYKLYRALQETKGHKPTETDYWEEVGILYQGVYDAATAYTVDQCVSVGEKLYMCLQDCTGKDVTDTVFWTELTRTVCKVPRYRGIENPFGHLYKWCDGINIRISPTVENGGDGTSKVYTCSDPSKFSSTSYDGYTYVGDEARENDRIKNIIGGEYGEIICSEVGGGTTTWYCDYHATGIPTTETLRGARFGGGAINGPNAGLACVNSSDAPSVANSDFGSRLCYHPE